MPCPIPTTSRSDGWQSALARRLHLEWGSKLKLEGQFLAEVDCSPAPVVRY